MEGGYSEVLRNIELREIKKPNLGRRQALKDQKGICAKCKKTLNPCYSKYVEDSTKSSGFRVLCLDCYFREKK